MRAKLHEGMYRSLEQFEVCFFLQNYFSELDMKAFFLFLFLFSAIHQLIALVLVDV